MSTGILHEAGIPRADGSDWQIDPGPESALAMSLAAQRSLGHHTWAESAARVEEFLQEMIKLKKAAAKEGRWAHGHSR